MSKHLQIGVNDKGDGSCDENSQLSQTPAEKEEMDSEKTCPTMCELI